MSTLTGGSFGLHWGQAGNQKIRITCVILLCILLLCAYAPVLIFTASTLLKSEDMAQGVFAPLVAVYIAWNLRRKLLVGSDKGGATGLILLCLGTAVQMWSMLASSFTLSRAAFLISLAGCLVLLFGIRGLRTLLFPLCLLFFTFPISPVLYGELTAPLQTLASKMATVVFEGLNITAVREGNIIQLPSQTLSIIEACSGLRSLLTLLFFTLTYVYFFEQRRLARLIVISLSLPAAILLNVCRITITGVLAEKVSPNLSYGLPHEIVGWCCFFAGTAIVVLLHLLLIRRFGQSSMPAARS